MPVIPGIEVEDWTGAPRDGDLYGYLAKSATNTEGMSYDAMLYCKTNIGGYFFDGFLTVDYSQETQITEHPVETGAAIADHAYIKPVTLTMNVRMSDVHRSLVSGQFTGGYSRSQTAFKIIEKMQKDRIPVSVLCRFGLYENMLIKRLEANDNADTYQGLDATVTLTELPIARLKVVAISSAPQVSGSSQSGGTLQAVTATDRVDESLAYRMGFGDGRNK